MRIFYRISEHQPPRSRPHSERCCDRQKSRALFPTGGWVTPHVPLEAGLTSWAQSRVAQGPCLGTALGHGALLLLLRGIPSNFPTRALQSLLHCALHTLSWSWLSAMLFADRDLPWSQRSWQGDEVTAAAAGTAWRSPGSQKVHPRLCALFGTNDRVQAFLTLS